jgi:hypothetical protein
MVWKYKRQRKTSISEKLLDQALSWASNLITISDNDILIIKNARKSLLFNTGKPWTKKDSEGLFDVTMGSHTAKNPLFDLSQITHFASKVIHNLSNWHVLLNG